MVQKKTAKSMEHGRTSIAIYPEDKRAIKYIMLDEDLESPADAVSLLVRFYDRKGGGKKERTTKEAVPAGAIAPGGKLDTMEEVPVY